jgi:hypothetical protein
MLQRFENVPVQQHKEDGLSQEAQAQIKSLRETMIPILRNFAETKINIQREWNENRRPVTERRRKKGRRRRK